MKTNLICEFFREGEFRLNTIGGPAARIKIGLELAVLAALTGCIGYVDGGYGGAVVVPGPDVYFFGGGYERGRDVHVYSHRGSESRATAHPAAGGHGNRR